MNCGEASASTWIIMALARSATRCVGIRRILRADRAIRRHVYKAVKYLVKDAQHLRLRPEGSRCLRTGMLW
ncbi:hypothetical protein FA285_15370 [Pseudomonas aeruginosa]|nr:hypothetical protein [Pseudomonas aeruginosa]MCO3090070.1 hypothetical protein [Pseudomonas aeruginosa]